MKAYLMREILVGGLGRDSSVASLSIFSRADFSVSIKRSNSGWAEGRGMASVAISTMEARFPTSSTVNIKEIKSTSCKAFITVFIYLHNRELAYNQVQNLVKLNQSKSEHYGGHQMYFISFFYLLFISIILYQ